MIIDILYVSAVTIGVFVVLSVFVIIVHTLFYPQP